jgi:DUF4097 and DUF4098 domain-containing protein YvlB
MRNLVAATMLLLLATAAGAAELSETIDRTFEVRPGSSVTLTNVNGRITVSSWDQPRVRVVAEKKVEAGRNEVKAVLDELRVEFQQRDGGLVITTHHPRRENGVASIFDWFTGDNVNAQVRYEVTVPRTMNVDVTNTNGAIQLSNVTGRHELETTNGRIEVSRCAGSLDVSTTNGSIRAELASVNKGAPLRFETTNGRIEIALPSSFAANVDASTTNGSIRTDLPVTTTQISKNSLRGTINGGGTELRMRTTNGGIEIRTVGKS